MKSDVQESVERPEDTERWKWEVHPRTMILESEKRDPMLMNESSRNKSHPRGHRSKPSSHGIVSRSAHAWSAPFRSRSAKFFVGNQSKRFLTLKIEPRFALEWGKQSNLISQVNQIIRMVPLTSSCFQDDSEMPPKYDEGRTVVKIIPLRLTIAVVFVHDNSEGSEHFVRTLWIDILLRQVESRENIRSNT